MNKNYCKRAEIIAIDFDGTIVTHEYPKIGKPVPFAKEVIQMLINNGHLCFLWTMRDNETLEAAKKYCTDNGIMLCNYNMSPAQFSVSPKQYASIYIDDTALGCPLIYDYIKSNRPYVDWYKVAEYLCVRGLLTKQQFESLK
jgi:hypothetical protein